jgi:REP element-mobilizing transposase RayT
MKLNPNTHHRRSIRLKDYNYSQPGVYFITIYTFQRQCLLEDITDGKMILNQNGKIINAKWSDIPTYFTNTEIDESIVMPNHLHGIIWIHGESEALDAIQSIASPLQYRPRGTKPGSLNAIIQNFKSVSTRKINQLNDTKGDKLWQRNYYEHTIRNQRELDAIRKYIITNPLNWSEDPDNLANY